MRLALLLLLASATAASAQDSSRLPVPAPSTPRSGPVYILTGGSSKSGPAARMLVGGERQIGDRLSVGVVTRLVGARGAYPITETRSTADELYAEIGLSLRPALRLSESVHVAASAGYGVVLLTDKSASYIPINDIGFTVPLELEAAVRIWENIGLTTAVSRSIAVSSMRTESEYRQFPDGYALDHWTATVGIRLGRW